MVIVHKSVAFYGNCDRTVIGLVKNATVALICRAGSPTKKKKKNTRSQPRGHNIDAFVLVSSETISVTLFGALNLSTL